MKDDFKPTLEDRIARIEVLRGLGPIPTKWRITAQRVKYVQKVMECGLREAEKMLIINFGQALECE